MTPAPPTSPQQTTPETLPSPRGLGWVDWLFLQLGVQAITRLIVMALVALLASAVFYGLEMIFAPVALQQVLGTSIADILVT